MKKELVTFEQALALQELGFDEECIFVNLIENGKFAGIYTPTDYNDFPEQREIEINVPLKQQVFRWFREKYNKNSFIELIYEDGLKYDYVLYVDKKEEECENYGDGPYNTYEEAENACIDKLIQIAKK